MCKRSAFSTLEKCARVAQFWRGHPPGVKACLRAGEAEKLQVLQQNGRSTMLQGLQQNQVSRLLQGLQGLASQQERDVRPKDPASNEGTRSTLLPTLLADVITTANLGRREERQARALDVALSKMCGSCAPQNTLRQDRVWRQIEMV